MESEGAKTQIKQFLDKAYEKFLNPDPYEEVKNKREKRKEQVKRQYALWAKRKSDNSNKKLKRKTCLMI